MRAALVLALVFAAAAAPDTGPPSKPDLDVLGDVIVEATEPDRGGPRLMRLALPPVVGEGSQRELVDQVLRRDVDLSGQFFLLDTSDPKALQRAEAIVRTSVRRLGRGRFELTAAVFFDADADAPAHEATVIASLRDVRASTHRLVDELIATLTGYRGPFVSRLTFVATRNGTRSVYVIDPDGHALRRVTHEHQLAAASAFGPDDALYYSASVGRGRYKLYRNGTDEPLALDPPGSVYGIAFSPDRTRVALTIAVGRDVRLFAGRSDFTELQPLGDLPLTISPAITSSEHVAVAGSKKLRPRIWVDGRPASPRRASASAPDFCEHPDGTRLVYALGTRRNSQIVVADPRGRHARRVSRGNGRHSHPACSPDGRLIAFFTTRKDGQGPGLYVMRIDGHHLRKLANVRGDSLQWSRLADLSRPPTQGDK